MAQRIKRVTTILVGIFLLLPLGGGVDAVEADATLRVEKQGWYWRPAQRVQAEPPACPDPQTGVPCPNVTQQPNAIEQDHFATGFADDQPEGEQTQAVALFQFDLSWMRPGTEVFSAELVLEESNDDATHQNRRPSGNLNTDAPGTKLRACMVTEFWGASQPGLWEEVPSIDCKLASGEGTREETTVDGRTLPIWRFDITKLGQAWGEDPFANFGLAIVPASDASGEFQVSFHGDTRVTDTDPVTRRERIREVTRVRGTMSFDAPEEPSGGTQAAPPPPATGGSDGSSVTAQPALGSLGVSFGRERPEPAAATPTEPDVNQDVSFEPGPTVPASYNASTPAYTWIGIPIALVLGRLLSILFTGGGPNVHEHRVAAAYRRRAAPSTR